MRIFLIDFENVHSEGMTGVDHLTDKDEVVIFYSSNADSISFDILHKLMFCKSKLSYYKIKRGGKNALDFQLSCYLGYRVSKDPEAEFYIISKDNGYDFIMDFWECGYISLEPKIRRFNTIKMLLQWQEAQRKQKEKAIKAVETLASKTKPAATQLDAPDVPAAPPDDSAPETPDSAVFTLPSEEAEAVASLITGSKTTHDFYTGIIKRFGQKKGLEVYRHFKGDYTAEFKRRKETPAT